MMVEFCSLIAVVFVGYLPLLVDILMQFTSRYKMGCSLANTLRFQRLEFGREKLAKGPDVICQAGGHRWGALLPSGTHRPMVSTLAQRQLLSQAPVRSGHVVEGLEDDDPLPQALAVCAEAVRLATQWRQGLPHGQGHPFAQGRAAREAQGRQACGAKHDAGAARQQCALRRLCDQLARDQRGMGRTAGRARAAPRAGARTVVTTWQAALRAAREPVTPALQHAGIPAPRALVAATTALAVASVRGPTPAAILNRNAGAQLPQPPCRPSSPLGTLAPASAVSRACWRAMQCHISSRCPCVTGRARSRWWLSSAA